MKTYITETKVRWSDLDPNRHLANSSYMNFTSFARIEYLRKCGISLEDLAEHKVGPVILREEFSFFKEAHEGQEIIITTAITGNSENGEIFEFEHNLYDKTTGNNLAYSRLVGLWMSMTTRRKMPFPEELQKRLVANLDPENLKIMSIKDLKELPVRAKNVDPKIFENVGR